MAFGFHKPGDRPSRDRDDRDERREERPERAASEERPAREERPERDERPAQRDERPINPSSGEGRSIGRGYGSRRNGDEEAPRSRGGNPYPTPRETRDDSRDERRSFGNRDDRGVDRGGDRGGDRRDSRGYGGEHREERRSFGNRGDRGGYDERRDRYRDDRGDDRGREGGGFGRRDDRQGGYNRRDAREAGRWDGPPREEHRSFDSRDDRGGFRGRDDRGGYNDRRGDRRDDRGRGRWDGPPRDERRSYDRRDDRGYGGDRRDDRGGYGRRDDRRSYDRRDDRRGGGGFSRGGGYRDSGDRRDGPPSRSQEWRRMGRNDGPRQAPAPKEKRRFKPPTPPNLDPSKLNEPIRLNKFVARSTQYSRRESDELVKRGRVTVNGEIVNPGTMVQPGDVVLLDEKPLNRKDHLVYILINKPKGVKPSLESTPIADDEQPGAPQTLADVLRFAGSDQLSAVAAIEEEMLGLQLVSNDPNIAAHFEKQVPKETYTITLSEPGQAEMILKLDPEDGEHKEGILIAEFADDEFTRLSIVVRGGFPAEALKNAGIKYEKVDRLHFAGLTKKDLPRGHWRFLNEKEVTWVTMFQQ